MIFFSVIMVTIGILQIFDFIYLMVDRQTLSYTSSLSQMCIRDRAHSPASE